MVNPGDVVWIRNDLYLGQQFSYTFRGSACNWNCNSFHTKYAGMKVVVRELHGTLRDFFRIVGDSNEAWFHIGMINFDEEQSLPGFEANALLEVLGG